MDARKVKAGSRDAVNCIPDEILAKILSFLPPKQAASTSLISKRWRNLFPLMIQLFASQHHFYLDDSNLVYPEEDKRESKDVHHESFKAFVDKTFSGCNSIKKLSLKCTLISSAHTDINQWLNYAMERGVVDLDLRFKAGFTPQQTGWPFNGFTFKTLVKLTIGIECGHTYLISFCPNVVLLPLLKSLFINTICYACELLYRRMLLGCPILEELSLHYLRGKSGSCVAESSIFSICHKTLKRLKIQCNNSLDEHFCRYMQLNTPNLLYLDYSGFTLMVPSCPKSISLGSLVEAKLDIHKQRRYVSTVHLSMMIDWMRNVKTLSLSPASVKEMYSRCVELPFFTNLVKLYFESNEKEGWEVVLPRLLNKSPNLETLALKGLHCVSNHGVCIDRNEVKVLEIYGFRRGREVRQVKCLLQQMQFLQVMKVEIDAEADDNKKLRLIDHLLALPKPSSKFQIQFL